MPPVVLAAWDPAGADRAPVCFALAAARPLGADVRVAAVLPDDALAGGEEDAPPAAGRRLAELAAVLRDSAELAVVRANSPAAGLQRLIGATRPALAVLGAPLAAAHGRVGLGGTAARVLNGAECPVCVVPRGHAREPVCVTVGVLPNAEARRALSLGGALAGRAGVPLRVVTVLRRSPDLADARALAERLAPQCGTAAGAGPADVLRRALAAAAPGADVHVLVGDPADALLRYSDAGGLLVLGSRAYGPPGVVLAGGAALRVLSGARCPVVLTPRARVAAAAPAPAPAS